MSTQIRYNKSQAGYDYVLKEANGTTGRALRKQAEKVREAARLRVGARSGALKLSLEITHSRAVNGQEYSVGSSLSYAYMVHEGTSPHEIHGRTGGVLRFTSKSRIVYSRSVMHPGTRPNRYLTDNLWLALS
jgi:hypothetical protein